MRKSKEVIILGTGGNSIDILDICHELGIKCKGFLDDDEKKWHNQIHNLPVLGPLTSAYTHSEAFFVNGIGNPDNYWQKESIIKKTNIPSERFLTLIDPKTSISQFSQIGYGTVVFQNVTIGSNVVIGNHCIILPNTVISHGCILKDYVSVAAGACLASSVIVEKSCYLGSNCCVIQNVEIGENSLIGIGSVVLHNVENNAVYVGNPAHFLRKV